MEQLRRLRISRRKPLDDSTDHTEIGSMADSHTSIESKPATAKSFIEVPNTAGGNNSPTGRSVGDVLATWNCLSQFSRTLGKYDDSFDHLKAAVQVLSSLIFTFEIILGAIGRYQTIQANLITVFSELDAHFMDEKIQQLRPIILNISRTLEQEVKFAETKQSRSWSNWMINGVHDFDEVLECYQRIQSCLDMIALNATTNKKTPVDEAMMEYSVERLRISSSAYYRISGSAARCAPETRTHALEQLLAWVDNDEGRNIHWINGMPGAGKTTLLHSLCEILESTHRLAGSFFCAGDMLEGRDVKRIIPTIAYQLARFSRLFRQRLSQTLRSDPNIQYGHPADQLNLLLSEPLRDLAKGLPHNLVVVIDALDECSDHSGVIQFLEALSLCASNLPIQFILASRPNLEPDMRLFYEPGDRNKFELTLHELDQPTVTDDIRKYLRHSLQSLEITEEQLHRLSLRCDHLFVNAAALVRYISEGYSPTERLSAILEGTTAGDNALDMIYRHILREVFSDKMDGAERRGVHQVLGTLVWAEEPLELGSIAKLAIVEEEEVRLASEFLRSLLITNASNNTIGLYQRAFSEYLSDQTRSEHYYCDGRVFNQQLAKNCFDSIQHLDTTFNICELEEPQTADLDVFDLLARVEEHIPNHTLYACRHWATHLERSEQSEDLFNRVYRFLSTRLLLWMEIMNLTHSLEPEGLPALVRMKDFFEGINCKPGTRELLADACEFVKTFVNSPHSASTLSIYLALLPSWAQERPVYRHYNSDQMRQSVKNLQLRRLKTGSNTVSRSKRDIEHNLNLTHMGCPNVTRYLDLKRCETTPVAAGGFGDIFRGVLIGGAPVAIKCSRMFVGSDEQIHKLRKSIEKEVYTWAKLRHPNVHELIGLATFQGRISIVSPWMANGTLPEYLRKKPDANRFQMCKELSEGLAHLHAYDVIHGDLKGANVLISNLGVPKLTDFGNTTLSQYTVQFTATTSALPISLRWTAPELVKGGKSFTKEADVYALGMVFFEIVSGEVPFAKTIPEHAVYSLLMKGETPEVPPTFGNMEQLQADMLRTVMAECWKSDLAERPSANDIQLQLSQAETQGSEDQVSDAHVG